MTSNISATYVVA